jgi:hypothetical protein
MRMACAKEKAPLSGGALEVKEGSTQRPYSGQPIESIKPCRLWGREFETAQTKKPQPGVAGSRSFHTSPEGVLAPQSPAAACG